MLANFVRATCILGAGIFLCTASSAFAVEWSSGLESSGIERFTENARDAGNNTGSGDSNYDSLSQQDRQLRMASEINQQINTRESPSPPESVTPDEDVAVGGWFAPPAPEP